MQASRWLVAVWMCLAATGAGVSASAYGAGAAAPAGSAADGEEELDDGLKGFGYLTGLALGCVATAQRPALEREALDLNAEVSRLFGADRAFLYAAAFGYGSSVQIKVEDCKTVLDRYDARVAKFRQGRKGGQS